MSYPRVFSENLAKEHFRLLLVNLASSSQAIQRRSNENGINSQQVRSSYLIGGFSVVSNIHTLQ